MVGFDVESLFTNLLSKETIDSCVEILIDNKEYFGDIPKDSFHEQFK